MLAPVIVFAYNRADHLEKTLDALSKNRLANETELFIFVDGPKKEAEHEKNEAVYQVAKKFLDSERFYKVTIERSPKNKGLANSIISGVTKTIQQYGKVIVVEDDLISAVDFLEFMNQGLENYQNDSRVGAISGFAPAVRKQPNCCNGIYKSRTGNSYGWGTWKEIWECVDWDVSDYDDFVKNKALQKKFDAIQYGISKMLERQQSGEINSWAVRWDYHFFKNNLWTVYPNDSHISNIGFDGQGSTTNNKMDRRKNIGCRESEYLMRPFEELCDWTKWTADSFRPTLLEKIFDCIS